MMKGKFWQIGWLFAVIVICSFCLTATGQDISTGLEAYWSFDSGSGTVAEDLSTNGRDMTFRNGEPQWAAGLIGGALEFDGDDDLSTSWTGIGGDTPRTVAFWSKTDWDVTDISSGIVGWGTSEDPSGQKWHIRLNSNADNGTVGAVRTEIQGNYIIGSTPINDGEWHHVASVLPEGGFLNTDVIHYIDGEVDPMSGTNNDNADLIIDTASDDGGTDVTVGSRLQGTTDQFHVGTVDEVRIYSRELSQEEIQALVAQAGGGGASSALDWELYY